VFDAQLEGFGAIHSSNYNWPMTKEQAIRTGRHCVFMMHIHLVYILPRPNQAASPPSCCAAN
ncbi:MAG: hypothetical protein KBG58_03835, partial [Giesbergeria sp.]|nr:hypothetical protein [Giesbergeria sp.]